MYTSINQANDAVIARIKAARRTGSTLNPPPALSLNCVKAACCCMPAANPLAGDDRPDARGLSRGLSV